MKLREDNNYLKKKVNFNMLKQKWLDEHFHLDCQSQSLHFPTRCIIEVSAVAQDSLPKTLMTAPNLLKDKPYSSQTTHNPNQVRNTVQLLFIL